MSLENVYQEKDIDIDRNATLQASLEARGLIFFYQSIEFNNLNIFCSICLYKMLTSKTLLLSTGIRLSGRAFRPMGLFFLFQLIYLNKLNNFCSICLYKMFTSKKLSISTYIHFSRRALRPVGLFLEINR